MRSEGIWLRLKIARRAVRRLRQSMRFGRSALAQSPILFANSFPKSGTHLLIQVMEGFSQIGPAVESGLPAVVTFEGDTGRQRSLAEILSDLHRFLPGDIGYGHVHAFPGAVELLCQPGWAAYFILRDPRDVAVSHVHYVADMAPNHIHHRYYHEMLGSFDERLRASITGVQIDELQKASNGRPIPEPLPNIRARFAPFLGWMEHPEVLILHYEDFIADRQATLERVLDHAARRGFKPATSRQQALLTLEGSIDPRRSPTFRSGNIGAWRDSFTPEHRKLFEQVSGDLIQQLGYPD